MNHKEFLKKLIEIDACGEAVKYVKKNEYSLKQAWNSCKRADWMLWLACKMDIGTRAQRIHATCDCAETSLHYFEDKYPDDKRPRQAIEAARQYADNPTEENKTAAARAAARAAGRAAWAATRAAEAAGRAAEAAGAAARAAWVAWAAEAATRAAGVAWAAEAATRAAGAAWAAAHKKMCKLIRRRIKV